MLKKLKRFGLFVLSYLFSDNLANWFTRFLSKKLVQEMRGAATDAFLVLLLRSLDIAFCVSRAFRKNIRDFRAQYVFRTADGAVAASAAFDDGDMHVSCSELSEPNVEVTFVSASALRAFLLSKDQDILNSVLANDVEVEGNLNYIYRFGFLANDLQRRLGLT